MNEIKIPKKIVNSHKLQIETLLLRAGSTTIIVGANGTGKTRLAVYIEEQLGEKAHRIAAHRALNLNPNVSKIPEKQAKYRLLFGRESFSLQDNRLILRKYNRWQNHSATHLLNDFDGLLQYLFAQQSNLAVEEHKKRQQGEEIKGSKKTHFDKLQEVWETLLPHRKLHITADNILVSITDDKNPKYYSASEMSDGERAIFYILGQVLCANENTVLIFDEPELHIHQSIIANLWDKIEELRPDCAFLVITHDIAFASTRTAEKYVIRNFYPHPVWDIEEMPDSEFDEQTITMILGSRKPILFVEGTSSSLDMAVYRACYPEWTIIPQGSCKDVIHAVQSLNKLSEKMSLLHLKCAGIVDNDTRDDNEIAKLKELNIYPLTVAEIENIFSLTDVVREILKENRYSDSELETKLSEFQSEMISFIKNNLSEEKLNKFVVKLVQRRIDNYLKNIDLSSSTDTNDLIQKLSCKITHLIGDEIPKEISEMTEKIKCYLNQNDLNGLCTIYENKGLFAEAARLIRETKKDEFEKWLERLLKSQNSELIKVVEQKLPNISVE